MIEMMERQWRLSSAQMDSLQVKKRHFFRRKTFSLIVTLSQVFAASLFRGPVGDQIGRIFASWAVVYSGQFLRISEEA
jgi:hypothetical protein